MMLLRIFFSLSVYTSSETLLKVAPPGARLALTLPNVGQSVGILMLVILALAGVAALRARRGVPHLPLSIAVLRWIGAGYLFVFKRFSVVQTGHLPMTGPVIVVCNHVKAHDPVCLQVASRHRLIRFMQAREYYELPFVHYLLRLLQVIPVNRNGKDTTSIRTAMRVLSEGGCLGIFPEGKISEDGKMNEGRKGVGLLALASNATVIPAYIWCSRPHAGMLEDFVQFSQVTLSFGEPVRLEDLRGGHRDERHRNIATQRIMDAIIALRDSADEPLGDARRPDAPIIGVEGAPAVYDDHDKGDPS